MQKGENVDKDIDVAPSASGTTKGNRIICPKCGSTNIFISKKGFNASDACCGALLIGPLGLLCGQHGANKIMKTCLDCNKKF